MRSLPPRTITILALFFLGGTSLATLSWTGSDLPETSRQLFGTVLASDLARALIFGLGLLVAGGLAASRLLGDSYRLLRGAGLALLVGGGYELLAGLLLALQRALPWPGLPEALRALLTLAYAGAILLAGRRYFFGALNRSDAGFPTGKVFAALGLGCLLSLAWPGAGAPGTASDLLLAVGEALGMGLLGSLWLALVFYYAPEIPSQDPVRGGLWAAAVFAALAPGLFSVRGWSSQGSGLGLLAVFNGLAAAGLMATGRQACPGRNWPAAFSLLFAALVFPLAFTAGPEGDWVPGGLPAATGTAILAGMLASLLLAVLLFAMHRRLQSLHPPAVLGGLVCLSGLGAALAVTFYSGKAALQPETFFVVMAEQADTRQAQSIPDLAQRREAVYKALTRQALASQSAIRAELDRLGVRYRPYYLVNGLEVYGYPGLRQELARRPDVSRILDSPHMRPQPPQTGRLILAEERPKPSGLSWGVAAIRADLVWKTWGVAGKGVVVGAIGSGVDWQHPDLRPGYLGSGDDNDYTWYDPWEGTRQPVDNNGIGIGTHTMGTVLGRAGSGVAPGASWIACRSLAHDMGNLPLYLDCMQFLLAPFPQAGDAFRDGDPARGAQIVNATFICPPWEGCDTTTLSLAVDHLRHAGQMFVAGAGNEGPYCSSILPPGLSAAALTVGAIGRDGQVAAFSGRGPVIADSSGRIKPDLVAPGVGILSSMPGGRYAEFNGTSMAAAHVSGVVALIWSANPSLAGDIDRTLAILAKSASPVTGRDGCGGSGRLSNTSGAGLVDAFEAVRLAMQGK